MTSDDLGVGDSSTDNTIDNKGINITAKFWLTYANNRSEAL